MKALVSRHPNVLEEAEAPEERALVVMERAAYVSTMIQLMARYLF